MNAKNFYLDKELTAFRRHVKTIFCYQNEMQCYVAWHKVSICVFELEEEGLFVICGGGDSTIPVGCVIADLERASFHKS